MEPLRPDLPLSLGAHLDELRRRLVWPIVVFVVAFVIALGFGDDLKLIFAHPLVHGMEIAEEMEEGVVALAGLTAPPGQELRLLKTQDLAESMMVSMSLSFWAAIAVTIPLLLHQLYQFIAVGLQARERHLAFLFVPVAVICFYAGACFGYYLGMPYFFAWFIKWTAHDPIGTLDLRMAYYRDAFFFYTICFGLMWDVPWAVVVVNRVGLLKVATMAKARRIVFLVATVMAALIAPGDPISMVALMIPLYGLFELGMLAAHIIGGPKPSAPSVEEPHA